MAEVLNLLTIRPEGRFADLTFGEGGHTEALLQAGATAVTGLDQDLATLTQYRETGLLRSDPRLELRHGTLRAFAQDPQNAAQYDGILADLGVSTFQLLHSGRGFTFQKPEPLDMRMDMSSGIPLSERLEGVDEEDLAQILWERVGLKKSRAYARRILEKWRLGELQTTMDLAAIASQLEPPRHPGAQRGKTHPATVLFLGLRMWVNEEFEQVADGVPALLDCLKVGGRLAVITFHSVEDRLVKHAFQRLAGARAAEGETEFFATEARERAPALLVTTKPIVPTPEEIEANPRSRSAKLRCIERRS